MAILICAQCGKRTVTSLFRLNSGQRYCSQVCKAEAARTKPTRAKVEVRCLQCQGAFLCPRAWVKEGRRKFCNRTCRNRYLKTLTGARAPRYGKPHTSETRDKIARTRAESGKAKRMENHPGWKGGTYVCGGYREVMIATLPADQQLIAQQMTRKRYILQHRIVMATVLGRPLKATEVVHHVNGNKLDNRPENLTLMDWGPHSRTHRQLERKLAAALFEIERLKSLLVISRKSG
jgi:HNH endonuclease